MILCNGANAFVRKGCSSSKEFQLLVARERAFRQGIDNGTRLRVRPIFQNRLSELRQSQLLLQRAATSQQKDDVLRDEKRASEAFNSLVESVLTPSQKNEWREMRSAVREKIEDRSE